EDPQIRSGQQLGRQLTVVGDDRVDVRRVEQRQTGRGAGRGGDGAGGGGGVRVRHTCSVVCGGSVAPDATPVLRESPGRIRCDVNHSCSCGLQTRTGPLVVGRNTPGAETAAPTSELMSVDLPAPVEPPTTARGGGWSSGSLGGR